MSDKDFDTLRRTRFPFSRVVLKAENSGTSRSGTFSDTHEAFVTSLLQGHAAIEAKLESAVRGGAGAAGNEKKKSKRPQCFVSKRFGHLEERLHAESMKH